MLSKILVIQFSSIRNIVLSSPVLRCIKKQLPEAELHFLTSQSFLKHNLENPYVNRFFYLDNDLQSMTDTLANEAYDYVIDLDKSLRSFKIKKKLQTKSYTLRKLTVEKFLLTRFNINIMPGIHYTQRCINTVAALAVKDDGLGLDYFIPAKDIVSESDLPHSHLFGFIVLAIGASSFTKKLPVHKLKELCRKIEYPIILLGGSEAAMEGEQIAAVDNIKVYNACGKFNLNETADIIRQSKLVIAPDTALQYISCAFKKPLLALWGATTPALDVGPYYGKIFMDLQQEPVYENIYFNPGCQPCSFDGTRKCPMVHFDCMEKLDTDRIVKKANKWLGK